MNADHNLDNQMQHKKTCMEIRDTFLRRKLIELLLQRMRSIVRAENFRRQTVHQLLQVLVKDRSLDDIHAGIRICRQNRTD